MKTSLPIWCATVLLMGAAQLQAQQYGETVQVTVIEVPVTVADRSGNAVRGLMKNDFEVFDEGKKVPIGYFEVVDLASVDIGETRLPPAAYRNFLLLFDLANTSPPSLGRARDAATEFVQSQISSVDVAAVATYSARDGIRLLTNFTRDRLLLTEAIGSIGASTEFHVPDALMITSLHTPSPNQPDALDRLAAPDGLEPGERGSGASIKAAAEAEQLEKMRQLNRMTEASYEKEQIGRIQAQISNFGSVALALDRLHGQKQVILLSEGFPAHLLTGRQKLGFQATQEENDYAAKGQVWEVDTEKRFGSVSGVSEINDMAQLFRRSDVRMHAIDIGGLRVESGVTGSEPEQLKSLSNEGLSLVARPTGGSVFRNSNDLTERFRSLLKSQEVIYLLGLDVASTHPGKFHELKVKTSARNAQVTHRAGYFETSPAANSLERTIGAAEVLVKDMSIDDIPVNLLASAIPGRDKFARVPVVTEISGSSLANGLGVSGTLDVFVYAFDENGKAVDYMQQRIELDLTQTGEMLTRNGVRFFGTLHLPAGTYSIRALARVDETARMGSRSTRLTVPAFGEQAVVAPIALDESTGWITILSRDRGQEAVDLVAAGEKTMIPEARVAIGQNSEQRIALMLYRIPVENLAVTPSIVSADGATRAAQFSLVGRTAADEDDVTRLVFDLKPAGLDRGSYDLRLTVTPQGGTPRVLTMPFVVQ